MNKLQTSIAITKVATMTTVAMVPLMMVVTMPAITGAEDFSFFQEQIPGLYFFLGGLPAGGTPAGHHTPDFFIDESGLELGVRSLSHLVVDYFNNTGN